MTTALTPLTDFSDRLSPMVVKELRQGLRTRAFGSTMLLMHVLLILVTLITGFSANTEDTRWMLDGLATLVLCLVMPFRVSNALAEEVKLNTLDMLMLTRLSCSRIVFGKWASVALQSLLIAMSLLPYMVSRYVFGGIDLMMELNMLGFKWLVGIVIAAVLVALSTIRQSWLRMVIIIVPLFFGGFGLFGFMIASLSGGPGFGGSTMDVYGWAIAAVVAVVSAVWAIFACLSLAASRISSPASALAWLKRTVHGLTILGLLIISWSTGEHVWAFASFIVAAFLTLDVMTEHVNDVPSVYVPFFKRGALGRLLMPLLAPGWASGFLLSVVVVLLIGGTLYLQSGFDELRYYVLICCTVWMMTSIIQILPTRRANDLLPIFLGTFALVYLLVGMFCGLGIILAKSGNELPWFLAVLPPAAIIGSTQIPSGAERDEFLRLAMLCGAVWPLIMVFLSARVWRRLRPVFEQAQKMAA
jgi:hypothetical protein